MVVQSIPRSAEAVQLAYRLDVNEYLGLERLQLVVEHPSANIATMEITQLKRTLKDLEERAAALRRYL